MSEAVTRHDVKLTDRDVDTILDAAKTMPSVVARLKENPYRSPETPDELHDAKTDSFLMYLKRISHEVAAWPEWKKDVLGWRYSKRRNMASPGDTNEERD